MMSRGDSTRSSRASSLRPDGPVPVSATCEPASVFSTFLRVMGSAASGPASMMPNRAANLASGGAASVLTGSGNRFALTSVRPASSTRPSGTASVNAVRSGSGAGKLTPSMKPDRRAASSMRGFQTVPAASLSWIRSASATATGAVKSSRIGSTGMQSALAFTRSQPKRAVNAGRTRKASDWSALVATPEAAAMPLPHTRRTSAPLGRRDRQATSVIGRCS